MELNFTYYSLRILKDVHYLPALEYYCLVAHHFMSHNGRTFQINVHSSDFVTTDKFYL